VNPDDEGRTMQIATLYERDKPRDALLSPGLEQLYDGGLSFPRPPADRPYVIGNFVETIDGVVTFGIPGQSGGGPISGDSADDRFVMGLLRATADAVLFGSGTLHGDSGHVRTPEFIYPEAKDLYDDLRKRLGKPRLPLNVVMTASGKIDLREPTFHTKDLQIVIVTTEEGASRIRADHGAAIAVRSTGERGATTPGAVLALLKREFGIDLLLHEGGPTVFGEFIAARLIDELFLTLAPQVAGRRDGDHRLGFAGATSFIPETAPWFSLASVKRGSDHHLLLRYASDGASTRR
jgi:riboflavin biosynthesis pyrimidine reductase